MKQTIREKCFETNSSSYHTLTIQKIKNDIPRKEIKKGEDLIINEKITYKTIGYTESYCYIGRSTYEKAQLVLRFMGYVLEEQLDALVDRDSYENSDGSWDYEKRNSIMKEKFYEAPLIKAFVKAIKRYIGEDFNVIIEFSQEYPPFIETVGDESKSLYELLEINKEDLNNVDILTDKFYNIIFDNSIEMIEECESNE